MYVCGLFVHQKCSNYALIDLLFGLCKSIWIIDSLVACHLSYSPSQKSNTPFSPQKCYELRNVPQFIYLLLFSFWDLHLSLSRSLGVCHLT
jgi:hypothetical protein